MHIKSNTNLEEYIDDYKDNNINKNEELFMRIVNTLMITVLGCIFIPIIGFNIKETFKPIWPIIVAVSLTTGLILQHFLIKNTKENFIEAKEKLTSVAHRLTENNIVVDEKTLSDSKITKETTKVKKNRFSTNNVLKTTIKKFYFLDNKEQIRVLKEVKQTILNENKKKETSTELYLEEVTNEEELPVKKTLKLNFK